MKSIKKINLKSKCGCPSCKDNGQNDALLKRIDELEQENKELKQRKTIFSPIDTELTIKSLCEIYEKALKLIMQHQININGNFNNRGATYQTAKEALEEGKK